MVGISQVNSLPWWVYPRLIASLGVYVRGIASLGVYVRCIASLVPWWVYLPGYTPPCTLLGTPASMLAPYPACYTGPALRQGDRANPSTCRTDSYACLTYRRCYLPPVSLLDIAVRTVTPSA